LIVEFSHGSSPEELFLTYLLGYFWLLWHPLHADRFQGNFIDQVAMSLYAAIAISHDGTDNSFYMSDIT
jgi:hypothetical protein